MEELTIWFDGRMDYLEVFLGVIKVRVVNKCRSTSNDEFD